MYHIFLEFASLGASYWMVKRIVNSTFTQTGMNLYNRCTKEKFGALIRLMCTSNLEMLSHLLCNMWSFSIALYEYTHASTSYLDFQVCFLDRRYPQFPRAGSPNQGVSHWATNFRNDSESAICDSSREEKFPD